MSGAPPPNDATALIQSLQKIDPVLRFLTKATGETTIPRELILKTLPIAEADLDALVDLKVLHRYKDRYGFPTEPKELMGSTKRAAQKRLTALRKQLKEQQTLAHQANSTLKRPHPDASAFSDTEDDQKQGDEQHEDKVHGIQVPDEVVLTGEAAEAYEALRKVLKLRKAQKGDVDTAFPSLILPKQVSYAGSTSAHASEFAELPKGIRAIIPDVLYNALVSKERKLYSHQAKAVHAAMSKSHCSICTGTGSGKSLCFLLPTLTAAYNENKTSLLLFPTKALAQDQLSKLQALVATDPSLKEKIRPATLDGDTPQSARKSIAEHCNIILTNPDTLHAALLPNWKMYQSLFLGGIAYVVIDEAHVYDGIFGAHVAMIVRRLVRLCSIHPVFICTSATLPFPEHRFRQLVGTNNDITVLTSADDGSPRAAKHFMVWNPAVLNLDGTSVGSVWFPRPKTLKQNESSRETLLPVSDEPPMQGSDQPLPLAGAPVPQFRRRHAADETARLLAKAVANGVRCIAFCKTRNLVEWVYSRTLELLKTGESTKDLMSKVESYRGGYSMNERRKIEGKLFRNELIGVVGTNALELGVDVGGIDLTLHCGYPTSYASLLQQAGRAGRGAGRLDQPSLSIVICFNSPAEQHMWRKPDSLLARELSSPHSVPIRGGVIQGHLLCAGEECPIVADQPASVMLFNSEQSTKLMPTDRELFGLAAFDEAMEELQCSNSLIAEELPGASGGDCRVVSFRPRPSFRRAWTKFSIRSIEPISFSIVDVAHPQQAGKMDTIHSEDAVLDVVPYSKALPPLEYNTFGIYICADSAGLAEELGQRYGEGVHALSHAILAVSPLFAHGIQRDDLECDHSYFSPTRVVLVDERAGGSGCVRRLWDAFFSPTNIVEEAIKLLKQCSYCSTDPSYDGGCPGCIHAHSCLKFNMNLSRSAAIVIGERMLERIKCTKAYQLNVKKAEQAANSKNNNDVTPRREAREKKLRRAQEIPLVDRSFIVGRISWPTDTENGVGRQEYM